MAVRRWFCFEVYRPGRYERAFIGRCETTLEEVRATFPRATVEGNLVTIHDRP